jgi:hypothetical protein
MIRPDQISLKVIPWNKGLDRTLTLEKSSILCTNLSHLLIIRQTAFIETFFLLNGELLFDEKTAKKCCESRLSSPPQKH